MKKSLRLSHILLIINMIILALPLSGIALFNLFDSRLVQETENELTTQAVILAALYKKKLLEYSGDIDIVNYGLPQHVKHQQVVNKELGKWRPLLPTLDVFKDTILEKAPVPIDTGQIPDPIAVKLGINLEKLLKEIQISTLAGIRILDFNGIIVASTGWTKYLSLANMSDVQEALQGVTTKVIRKRTKIDSYFSAISRTSEIRVHVTHPIILNNRVLGAIHLLRTPSNVSQHIVQNKNMYMSLFALVLAVMFTITLLTTYAITQPIKALVRQAKKASQGRQHKLYPLKQPITTEFELLSKALVKMTDKQAARAEQINAFASYVSHEFKTPITAIRGAVDILQEHQDDISIKEQHHFLKMIAANCQRMNILIKQLTQLAKADNAKIPRQPFDLVTIITRQISIYKKQLSLIDFQPDQQFLVFMDDQLLTSVIVNLFDNVIQHGGDKVWIKIHYQKDNIYLEFMDNGKGISEQNAKRIFEPFFTTAKTQGGTGLGLAILKTLLKAHHGDIEYKRLNNTNQGYFSITLPKA